MSSFIISSGYMHLPGEVRITDVPDTDRMTWGFFLYAEHVQKCVPADSVLHMVTENYFEIMLLENMGLSTFLLFCATYKLKAYEPCNVVVKMTFNKQL